MVSRTIADLVANCDHLKLNRLPRRTPPLSAV